MDDNIKKELSSLVEKLAADFMMLDLNSPDELVNFNNQLKKAQGVAQAGGLSIQAGVISLVLSLSSEAVLQDPKKIGEVISCGIKMLQELSSGCDSSESEYLQKAKEQLNSLATGDKSLSLNLPDNQDSAFFDYVSSTELLLDGIENNSMGLEADPKASDKLNSIFRAFHTIKSEAALVGIKNISEIAHEIESLLEKVRSQELAVNPELVTLILSIKDFIKGTLDICKNDILKGVSCDISKIKAEISTTLAVLAALKGSVTAPLPVAPSPESMILQQEKKSAFAPKIPVLDLSEGTEIISEFLTESFEHMNIAEGALLVLESSSGDSEAVNKIFREFHTIKGLASFLNLDDVRILAHDTETMMEYVRKGELKVTDEVVEAILLSIDNLRKLLGLLKEQVANGGVLKSQYHDITPIILILEDIIHNLKKPKDQPVVKPPEPLGEILVQKEIITEEELVGALQTQEEAKPDKKIGEILVASGVATPTQIDRGLDEQKKHEVADETIKISIKKLDDFIDMAGELVITGSQITQNPDMLNSVGRKMANDMAHLGRIIRGIQSISMSMRLVVIKPLFQKMLRLTRDISRKSKKEIDIRISGEDTEIDKNIIDLISDPLVHMVRNAIDHGIEPKDLRVSRGKSASGRVELSAYHKGGNIVIEVKDDGGGLDKDKILKKAQERGLVKAGEVLEDKSIYNLIFEPGFSTADKITDISGRGVGMDVVKKNITQLRGKVDIETELDKGTKFTIKLPLTLAIIDGIILSLEKERYVIPIYSVREFIQPRREDISTIESKGEMIKVHGGLITIIRLDQLFGHKYKSQEIEDLVGCIIESDYGRACILFDELISQQQVVIKSLGGSLGNVLGLAGATILGDGKVGLILDINGIVELSRR